MWYAKYLVKQALASTEPLQVGPPQRTETPNIAPMPNSPSSQGMMGTPMAHKPTSDPWSGFWTGALTGGAMLGIMGGSQLKGAWNWGKKLIPGFRR